jgi:pyridoxamine 5'-phosphate oxidase
MIPWLLLLRNALGNEFDRRPLVMTLATVDETSGPRARSVICRHLDDGGRLLVVSDARSDKSAHLRRDARAEVVMWLEAALQQFRFRGAVEIASDARRAALWRDLSPASRALFFWPPPGQPFDPRLSFPEGADDQTAPPASFELLVLAPDLVERLDLNPHPHDRRRWDRAAGGWVECRLNP